jgi:hypothetical protein
VTEQITARGGAGVVPRPAAEFIHGEIEHLDETAISKIFGRAVATLQKDRLIGEGPPFIKVGRLVRYRPSDVRAWLELRSG